MSAPTPEQDPIVRMIGDALVEWSRIEAVWANIFSLLLFRNLYLESEVGEAGSIPSTDSAVENDTRMRRAKAVYFSVNNGVTQGQMIASLAAVVLEDQPALLKQLVKAIDKTRKLAKWRNSIAHDHYEREWIPATRTEKPVIMGRYGNIVMKPTPRSKFHSADPIVEIPKKTAEFSAHVARVQKILLALYGLVDVAELLE